MVTKTITIMDDAYQLLANNKLEDESFSEEIRRLLAEEKMKKLSDFFGILNDDEGKSILKNISESRKTDIKMDKLRNKWN